MDGWNRPLMDLGMGGVEEELIRSGKMVRCGCHSYRCGCRRERGFNGWLSREKNFGGWLSRERNFGGWLSRERVVVVKNGLLRDVLRESCRKED